MLLSIILVTCQFRLVKSKVLRKLVLF